MSRGTAIAIAVLLAVLAVTAGVYAYQTQRAAQLAEVARAEAEERVEREARRVERDRERIADESAKFLPQGLGEIALAMERPALRKVRPEARLSLTAQETGMQWLEETLENGAKVLYGFDQKSDRLVEVQILSTLSDPDVLGEHLRRLHERLGQPSGVVDCPTPGSVPTRRFVWVASQLTFSDVLVIYGRSISLTMKLEPNARAASALENAACRPVTGEALGRMPAASPEQLDRARAGGGRGAVPGSTAPLARPELPAAYR